MTVCRPSWRWCCRGEYLLFLLCNTDAPYHLKKYPNSAFSKFFRAHMCCKYPEYAEFCGEAISKAGAIAEARNTEETRDLNPATQ